MNFIDFQVPKVAEIVVKWEKGGEGFSIFGDNSQLLWNFLPFFFGGFPKKGQKVETKKSGYYSNIICGNFWTQGQESDTNLATPEAELPDK